MITACDRHGGTANGACTQCEDCKGAWTGATHLGIPFLAPSAADHSEAVPILAYSCGTDTVFSPTPIGTDVLYSNQELSMYQQLVSADGHFVAEVDYTGRLRVFDSVACAYSVLWESGEPKASNSTKFTLRLLDDGRLVTLDSAEKVVWNSTGVKQPQGAYFARLADGTLSVFNGTLHGSHELVWQSPVANVSSPCRKTLAFHGVPFDAPDAIAVYEFYNPTTKDHAYNTSIAPSPGYYPKNDPPIRFHAIDPNSASVNKQTKIFASRLCLNGWCDTFLTPDPTARKSCDYWDTTRDAPSLLKEQEEYFSAAKSEMNKVLAHTKPICGQKNNSCVGIGIMGDTGATAVRGLTILVDQSAKVETLLTLRWRGYRVFAFINGTVITFDLNLNMYFASRTLQQLHVLQMTFSDPSKVTTNGYLEPVEANVDILPRKQPSGFTCRQASV